MYAAAYGSTGAVKLLLDKGADVNAKNQFDANGAGLGRERSGESESAHRKRRRC
jgi:ankyrin repeat protein